MDEKQMLIGVAAPSAKKRMESYQNLSKLSAEAAKTLNLSGCLSPAETKKAFINLKNDLGSQNEEEVYEAAGACIHLLASQAIPLQVDTSYQKALCDILIKMLKTHKKNNLITRILQSLAKSRFSKEVYLANLKDNFDTLSGLLRPVDTSVTVILETLQVMLVFFNVNPLASVELAESWFPTMFSELFHTHIKIRKVSVIVINHIGEALNKLANDSARGKLVNTVLGDLKKKYCSKDMMNLLYNKQYDVFRVWRTVVSLFDTQLHASRTLINTLLEVMDKAFKCTLSEVKVEAFLCWRTLIDNFALSRDAISNPRKLHLLISPFKLKNVKTEDVFNMKLLTWWHLVCVMSDKNCLVPNFDLVVVPLLHFCFISGPISESSKGGISNRNLIMSGALSSPGRSFSSLHCTSAEILVQLLATEDNSSNITLSVQAIREHVISSALFLRHYPLLMKCFGEAVQTLNFSDAQQKTLGIFLFRSLLKRIKTIAAPDVQKKEAVDVVRELFSTLSHIESHCEPESSNCHFLFEFYNILTIGNLALPNKILNSHQYRIAPSSGGGARDVMCGTLSNHLVTQLCSPALLQNALTNQRFFTLWETVLENSQPVTGKLGFLEDTIQEMSTSALPFLCPEHPAIVCRLWGTVLNKTLAHIEETKTLLADEGEPDWSCIYSVLQFPVIHATEAFVCCQVTMYEDIMELWRRLWEKFIQIARATPTVEPNVEVEEVASTLYTLCQSKGTEEPDVSAPMYFLAVEVLVLLTETFGYSKLGKGPAELPSSPAKPKRKPHPLHNLGACVELIALVFDRVCVMVTRQRNHMAYKICQASINMMEGILKAPMKYVKQFIIHIVKIMSKCLRVNPAVVFDFHVEQRFVDMLKCFSGLIEAYVTHDGVTESSLEHLSTLETLSAVALTSTNDKVKLEVHKLLNACILSIPMAGLEVPPLLLDAQRKWDQASVTHESIEDFIEATPKGRSSRKSLKPQEKPRRGPSRNSTPKSNLSSATKKTDRNKDGNGSAAAATSSHLSVKLLKSRNRRLSSSSSVDDSTSPVPSDVSVFLGSEDFSEGVGTSTSGDDIPVERVRKTRNREGKQKSESQQEKVNVKRVVPKDSDRTNHTDNGSSLQTETASTTFRKSSRKRSVKSDLKSSINLSKGEGNKSLDSITVFAKKESSSAAPCSTTEDKNDKDGEAQAQNCSKENVGMTDEENMLHDDIFRRKILKNNASSPDQGISTEQLKPNILKALNKTPQAESSIRSKRINFMEVSVSPSVVKDVKIVEKQPKVEISFKTDPDVTVSESDSENEIPSSLEVNSSIPRNSTYLSENNASGKVQLNEEMTDVWQDELMESSTSGGILTSGKRKRKLFDEGEHLSGSRKMKTARMSSQDESDSVSLDESVMIDLPDLSFDYSAASTTENEAEVTEPITPKKTRKTSASEMKSSRKVEDIANKNEESPAKKAKGSLTRDHKRGSAKESNESFTKDSMSKEIEEKNKTNSAFSPKVTRSGRKIVPPNKDMPQPMTPPKTSKRRPHQRGASEADKDPSEGSGTDFFDLHDSAPNCDENNKSVVSVTTESEIENEKEDKTSEVKDHSDDCIILDDDEFPSVKEGRGREAKSSDIRTYMRRRSSVPRPSESQKHCSLEAAAHCVEGKDSLGTITISSGDSVQEQSVKSSDNRESDNQSLNIADLKSALQEKKKSSGAPVSEGSLDDTESSSSRADKSKPGKPVTDKDACHPHKDVEKEGGVNQSEDSLDQQKTTDESTPMECAQTLVEEVSYPRSSRGTEALDDSGGNELLHKGGEVVLQEKEKEEEESDSSHEEDRKETEAKNVASEPPESPAKLESGEEEEEEGNESPCEDNEEMDPPDSPLAQDLEEEEEECIGAGQEAEEEEENTNTEGKVSIADGKQQDTTHHELQEPGEDKGKTDQESKSSDEDGTRDEKKSRQEVKSGKVTSPPPEEKAVIVGKHSELEETCDRASEKQDDSVKYGDDRDEEMEVESEPVVSKDLPEVEDASTKPDLEEKDTSEAKHKDKDVKETQTTLDGSQDKLEKEKALDSENVEKNAEIKEAAKVLEDLDEVDESPRKDVPVLSIGDSGLGERSKVESQAVSEKEQPGSENKDVEVETNEQKSTSALRKETETRKSSSDSAMVQVEEASSSHKENSVSVEVDMSSERADTDDGTVSSPRKTAKVKVDPRRTVQVQETDIKPRRVSSPDQTVQAMTATPLTRGKEPNESSVVNTDKAEEQGEGESDPKIVQVTERTNEPASGSERTTGSTAPMTGEASEEPTPSGRQQEEELSPDKSSRSRLKLTVSTPERLKRGALMHAGSRAALLVACAKQNIKNRGGGETESSSVVLTEPGRSRSLGSSPTRRSAPIRPSPGHSPDNRRRSHLDAPGMRPWMKHSPSPGASPSTSILKRTLLTDGTDGETPSPPQKYRRVSFADPPVSERVEIPPSPRTLKGIRAQKRLDMTRMASPVKDLDAQPVENQESLPDKDPEVLDYENPIFPALHTCPDKVEQVAQYLTSPATERSCASTPVKDDVEQTLAKMFGELDREDKENRRPNQQDCVADPVVMAEAEVRESSGRASHPDNIQEIMEMEDITPLDATVDDTELGMLKSLYRRASQQDREAQKRLLHHLLLVLPPHDVAEAIAESIKARMDVPTPSSSSTSSSTSFSTNTTSST